MGDARVTQSFLIAAAIQDGDARVTQSYLIVAVGVGVSCNNPPQGTVGQAYNHTFLAGSGDPPYTFFIVAGALPTGLICNGLGVVSGVPAVAGTFNFTVQVVDSLFARDSVECSIVIASSTTSNNTVGGVGVPYAVYLPKSRGGCQGYNEYDNCLLSEMQRWRHIEFRDLCVIPKEYRNSLPWPEEGETGTIPPQAIPVYKTGGIVTPTTASGDNVVVSWQVPVGYDGLLTGIFFGYSGNGFVQGSGDIITRLRINQRYIKDLGNNPYLLGSSQQPIPMTEGQILLSGMRVDSIVSVPNLSGNIVIGQSTIFAGQIGFIWPRG